MSFSRRLGRILRSHVGAWRDDSTRSAPPRRRRAAPASGSSDAPGERESEPLEEDVPPDVAAAYRALEVPVGSGRRVAKKSYRRLMKRYHQDRFENDPERRAVAAEVSKHLNAAYERVTDYLDRQGAP